MPAESFLSRWSKRKQGSREAEPAPTEPAPATPHSQSVAAKSVLVAPVATPASLPSPLPSATTATGAPDIQHLQQTNHPAESTALPPVETLTPESDFRPFMKPDVDPALRNQAMKSLFRDPHFNVMDMMDVYVDDYSLPDPIPESMLRQMTQSRMLKLFDDLPDEETEKAESNPESTVAVAHDLPPVEESPELGQMAPDKTICPTSLEAIAIDPQQAKPE